ncbi:MAG: SIS domain-containing protein [Candidatus Borkfalkiaceae bacterium]|nr:SIS domain-containing protein [Christensenellaceae bacterium]
MNIKTKELIIEIAKTNRLEYLIEEITLAVEKSVERIKSGGKVVVCGNGGSAADSGHIVGELMKGFVLPRKLSDKDRNLFIGKVKDGEHLAEKLQYGIPAVALTGTEAISTAVMNDNGAEMVFAQQAYALLNENDIFIGISTSGNAENVTLAMEVAKVKKAFTIALTGKGGGKMKDLADINLIVNDTETYRIQEKHLPIYHLYCMCLENEFFGE